uniref:Histone deacetylase complex subunit CTI6-like n=1 Tax=Saccoglossus kowalevskii TaxID=10224 RepID=A0ABM0MMH0_SACKO|nr:PREDICTED: histone deacetylase complex subunit CTI6-like [Saccoglossus kowalevskii]
METSSSSTSLTIATTDTVATTISNAKSASVGSKSGGHGKPSRLDRKKRCSAPAALPTAQEQTPVASKPPEMQELIVEVKEEKEEPKEREEEFKEETVVNDVTTPIKVDEVKDEVADISMESVDDPALTKEEIVHCLCNMDEEDGFMIQCETCLCWQHSGCVGLNENTVPKKYICCFCKNPAGHRSHTRYRYDQEWFKTGELAGFPSVPDNYSKHVSPAILATHDLVSDMHIVNELLHGLQNKLTVLQTPNHPDLRLWLKPKRLSEEDMVAKKQNEDQPGCSNIEMIHSKDTSDLVCEKTPHIDDSKNTAQSDDVSIKSTQRDDIIQSENCSNNNANIIPQGEKNTKDDNSDSKIELMTDKVSNSKLENKQDGVSCVESCTEILESQSNGAKSKPEITTSLCEQPVHETIEKMDDKIITEQNIKQEMLSGVNDEKEIKLKDDEDMEVDVVNDDTVEQITNKQISEQGMLSTDKTDSCEVNETKEVRTECVFRKPADVADDKAEVSQLPEIVVPAKHTLSLTTDELSEQATSHVSVKANEEKKEEKKDYLTPSVSKIPGSTGNVFTPVGKAKGSRKRTESLRSEISDIDVMDEVEPLPPLVCEWNLLQHISQLHDQLDNRMDLIEQEITALESTFFCQASGDDIAEELPHIKRNIRRLVHDLTKVRDMVVR